MGSSASPLPPPATPVATTNAAPTSPAPSSSLLLRQALVAFYEVHNPSQLAETLLDEIVGKYLGKEHQLIAKLQRRYGEAPHVPHLRNDNLRKSSKNLTPRNKEPRTEGGSGLEGGRKIEAEITNEARADLLSPNFDAAFILLLPHAHVSLSLPLQVKIPVPHAPLLDNLSRCRHLLPSNHPEFIPPLGPSAGAAAAARRNAILASKATAASAKGPPVLEALAESLRKGPTALLYRCWKEGRRVVVVMRRIDGVRGTVEGELRGFDRHMNVILGDAQEVFVLPTTMKEKKEEEVGEGMEGGKGEKNGRKRLVQRKRGRRAGKKHKLLQKQQTPPPLQQQQQQQKATKAEKVDREAVPELSKQQRRQQQQQQQQQQGPVIHRSLPQVLIRGDNVVMIFEANPHHVTCAFLPPLSSSVHNDETTKKKDMKKVKQEEGKALTRTATPPAPAHAAVPLLLSRVGGEKIKQEESGQGEGMGRKRPRLENPLRTYMHDVEK